MIRKTTYILVWLFWLFLQAAAVNAQEAEYVQAHYDFTDLIPDNQGRAIEKDINGFYWITTTGRWVLRWNGLGLNLISKWSNKADEGALFCNKDYTGRLFFSSYTSVIKSPDESGQLQTIDTNENKQRYFKSGLIGDFIDLKEKWPEIEKLNEKTLVNKLKDLLVLVAIPGKYTDKDEFYIHDWSGILHYLKGKLTFIPLPQSQQYWASSGIVSGRYFVALSLKGDYTIYLHGKVVKRGNRQILKTIYKGETGSVFSTKNAGFFLDQNSRIYRLTVADNDLQIEKYARLPVQKIAANAFYVDEETNRILILNLTGGLSVFELKLFLSRNVTPNTDDNIIYTLAMAGNRLYTNQDFKHKLAPGAGYDYNWWAPIAVLPDGGFFYPSTGLGTALFNSKLVLKKYFTTNIVGIMRSLAVFDNKVVFPFTTGGGLLQYDHERGVIDTIKITPDFKKGEGFSYIAKGPPGFLFAANGRQLYQIETGSGFRKQIADLNSLGKNLWDDLRGLFYSEEYNGLFFSVSNSGLYFLNLATGKIKNFPFADYPPLQSCHYVLKDNGGDYWLPTNNGLYLVFKKQMDDFLSGRTGIVNYYRFGKERGIQNLEFNGGFTNSGICSGDSVFLSSMNGVVSFSSSTVKKMLGASYTGRILLMGINEDDSLKDVTTTVSLRPGFKKCVVRYDFPFVNVPDAVLEYQLSGQGDSAWLPLPKNNEVLLRSLKAGTYVLTVRVQNNPRIPASVIKIKVRQYWYLTTLAFAVYATLAILFALMLFYWRLNVVKNRSLLELDKNRRQLFAIISHDLRSPLKTYQGMADVISYLLKRGEYGRIEQLAAQIDDTGAKLDLLLKNLLNWNLLEQQKLIVKKTAVDAVKLIEELLPLYRDIAANKDTTIVFEPGADKKTIESDEEFLSLIVRNLLDNAVKNAPAQSVISLIYKAEDGGAVLRFQNAITPQQSQKLKEVALLFNSNRKWEPGTQGMGMGLKMIKLAVHKLGGKSSIAITGNTAEWMIVL